jgi:5'-methylthioadenosine phosphorylase
MAYAAKALGAERVVAVVRDAQVSQSLAPADFIEFTSGRFTTFFAKIGAGYIQQEPPFCPEVRGALLKSGVAEAGVLLVVDDLPAQPARQWWAAREVTLMSTKTQPEGALCRELELCFAVLAVPVEMALERLGAEIATNLPAERSCGCSQTMAQARRSGKWPADWRQWVKVEA